MVTRFIHYKLPSQAKSTQELLQRIDYHGAIALILSLGPLLLALSYKNNDNLAYSNPKVFINLIIFFIFTITFILIEAHYALEPILPMRILNTRNGAFVALTNFFMVSF